MSFSSLPNLDLSTASSSQCSFQSAVFVRALLKAMNEQDFDSIHSGFDKALQLSLGGSSSSSKSGGKAGKTALKKKQQQQNVSSINNNTKSSPNTTTKQGKGKDNNVNTPSKQQQVSSNLIPHPPASAASSQLGMTSNTNANNTNSNFNASTASPGRGGGGGRNQQYLNASSSPAGAGSTLMTTTTASPKNPFALELSSNQQSQRMEGSFLMGGGDVEKNESTGTFPQNNNNSIITPPPPLHEKPFTVLDQSTLRHPQALPFSSPAASTVTASHPSLSIYSDWLFFCSSNNFSVLQTQHCLILLSELLQALSQVDPASASSPNNKNSSSTNANNNNKNPNHLTANSFHENQFLSGGGGGGSSVSRSSPSSSNKNSPSGTNVSTINNTTNQNQSNNNNNLSSVNNLNRNNSTTNSNMLNVSGTEFSSSSKFITISGIFSSQPPESVIETLTSFLSRSCERKKILVIDEEKVREVAREKQKAAEAAALLALQQSQQAAANEKDNNKKGGAAGGGGSSKNNKNNNSQADKSMSKHPNDHDGSLSGRSQTSTTTFQQNALLGNQQQQPQLVDPNPYVKEITVDPVFSATEIRAICSFVHETLLQHWRLVAVMVRNPGGLTLPITENVVIETLPIDGFPSLQHEGTIEKTYSDTQARIRAWTEAAQTLENCYNEAISERFITIRAEYERATLVAVRRDKSMREDDTRKQMRPEEFKRTVKVLSRVMESDLVLEQLAANPVALNKEDESTADLAKKTQEQMQEYAAFLKEEQMIASLGSASPGSTVTSNRGNQKLTKQQQLQQQRQAEQQQQAALLLLQQQQNDMSGISQDQQQDSSPPPLTLEQRLERLEKAIAAQQLVNEKQGSPGGSHRRSNAGGHR